MTRYSLSVSELEFLNQHGFKYEDLFIATGMKTNLWKYMMKDGGYSLAVGTKPCNAYGHTIRKHSGHCVQCNPISLVYQARHFTPGYVYVAESASTNLIKIGTTSDLDDRLIHLNSDRYGGVSDWKMKLFAHVDNAGQYENDIQNSLFDFKIEGFYYKGGQLTYCNELFSLEYDIAKSYFMKLIPECWEYT